MHPVLNAISLSATAMAMLFVNAPMNIIPQLDRSARMDLLDLYEAGMTAKTGNRFGGTCTMTHCSDTAITIHLTDVSTMNLRMVNDSVVELSHKVFVKDVEHTSRRLYDNHWKLIK